MTFKTKKMIIALGLGLGLSASALAGEATVSRHSFAKFNAAAPAPASQLPAVSVQPATSSRGSSITTTLTSDLGGATAAQLVSVPMRAAIASVEPTLATAAAARQLPLVAASVSDAQEAQVDQRMLVDRNAQLAGNYRGYAPATVTHEQAQLALAAHRVEHVRYGNTYGTYAPAAYHGRLSYSYAPRTYYQSTYYYSTPRYYTSTYCAPIYRPSYSYCAPVYRPSYSFGYGYYGRSYYNFNYNYGYYRPSYAFRYGYNNRCGSSFGFSIGW